MRCSFVELVRYSWKELVRCNLKELVRYNLRELVRCSLMELVRYSWRELELGHDMLEELGKTQICMGLGIRLESIR